LKPEAASRRTRGGGGIRSDRSSQLPGALEPGVSEDAAGVGHVPERLAVPLADGGDAGAERLEQAVRRPDHAPDAHGQRQVGRVEEVGLERRGGEGGRLLARLPRRGGGGGHERPDDLAREAGAQGVAADADVLGAEAVDGGAERLRGARQPGGAPQAVACQQAELVLDVAADGGRAQQRAPERDDGAGRAARARPRPRPAALVVALEDGAEHGAVAVVHQLVRQAEVERLPPLLRHRRRVPALLPLQLQQVHRLDQVRHHHPPVVVVPPAMRTSIMRIEMSTRSSCLVELRRAHSPARVRELSPCGGSRAGGARLLRHCHGHHGADPPMDRPSDQRQTRWLGFTLV
jgi:hypothetical protein